MTVLTLSNGVEVWLKPTDFKNDQVLLSAYALGGTSLAPRPNSTAPSWHRRWSASAASAGFNPVDLSKMLAGKIAQASPSIGDIHAGDQRHRTRHAISRRRCS